MPPPYYDQTQFSWVRDAAVLANKAWGAAESSGDWTRVDVYCFKLCVFHDAYQAKREWSKGPDRTCFDTVEEYADKCVGFIQRAYQAREALLHDVNNSLARRLLPTIEFDNVRHFCMLAFHLNANLGALDCRKRRLINRMRNPIDPSEFGDFDPNKAYERGEIKVARYFIPLDTIDKEYTGTTEDDEPRFTTPEIVVPQKRRHEPPEDQPTEQPPDHHDAAAASGPSAGHLQQPTSEEPLQPTGEAVTPEPSELGVPSPTGRAPKAQWTDAGSASPNAGPGTTGESRTRPEPADGAPAVEVDAAVAKDADST